MKKLLSILGAIGLTTSTTTLISCEKPKSDNNNEKRGGVINQNLNPKNHKNHQKIVIEN